jgi:hypothetical protein
VVPVDFVADAFFGDLTDEELTRALVAGAGTPPCAGEEQPFTRQVRERAAREVSAAWFLGNLRQDIRSSGIRALARPAWQELRALPADEQLARITALRKASLACDGDLLDVLEGRTR